MPSPELPPPSDFPLSRLQKEKLLQQMYTLPHWIAIVRLFGYKTLPMDDARPKIKPLADQYGKEAVAQACEALVEIEMKDKIAFARLKAHVRRMAFQILGPEEHAATTNAEVATLSPKAKTPKKRLAKNAVADSAAKPIRQPRHLALNRYLEWLHENGLCFVEVADVRRTTPAVQPFVSGLDFIVLREDTKLLVTVRPHLQAKHLVAIAELRKLFGAEYQPVRVWPTEGPDG